jgi:hypothetical protein
MKTLSLLGAAALLAATSAAYAAAPADPWAGQNLHPRLLVTRERLAAITAQLAVPGSFHQQAYAAMRARVDAPDWASRYEETPTYQHGSHTAGYIPGFMAREAALLALLADTREEQTRYATRAFTALKGLDYLGDSGLNRATQSMSLALACDWLYNLWTDEQRTAMTAAAKSALDMWPSFEHANLGDKRASNWTGVCRGGEMLLLLATREEGNRPGRWALLKDTLLTHMRNAFGSLGYSQEGFMYTEYPGTFLLPAIYACRALGDDDLWQEAQRHAWWRMVMYSHNFMAPTRKFVQTGVSSRSNYNEGWASLLFPLVPEGDLPEYMWWYNRHVGARADDVPLYRFEGNRAGTVWALLCYPEGVAERDPTGVQPAAVGDDRGYYFFRNRWRDRDDIHVSIMADTHHTGHAWDQPEPLTLNLMAHDTRYIGGPGKRREDAVYSALLVDGTFGIANAPALPGEIVAFEPTMTGGYAIVGGGALYRKLGVDDVRRHLLVDFTLPDGAGIVATWDRVTSAKPHAYTWQANIGDEAGTDGVQVTAGTEAGRPTFLLRGRRDGFVKGWVLAPADATVVAGGPLQIRTTGANVDILVVMLVGKGEPPVGAIDGARLTVTGKTIAADPATSRVVCH